MALTKIARRRLTEVPIGTILPHYDFNGILTFDTAIYKYCDGSVVADAESPLNTHTLPDMSNRYLVGFGTEAGGDIDTAAWPVGPETANWTVIGNASHQVALINHSHGITGASQSNTTGITHAHTHSMQSHTHNQGTLITHIGIDNSGGGGRLVVESAVGTFIANYYLNEGMVSSGAYQPDFATEISGNTGTPSSASTGAISTGVSDLGHTHGVGTYTIDSVVVATQNIQPRSLRVRFIIRIK